MLQEFVKFFINPVLQFFLLVLLFFKLKKPKKLLFGIIIYFFLASIPLTGKLFHYFWKVDDTYDQNVIYDYGVVLTGGVESPWYLENASKDTNFFNLDNVYMFNYAAERFFKGIEFAIKGKIKILMYGNYVLKSDDSFFDTSELVRKFAIKNGLPTKQFVIYGKNVKNTLDEATQFKSYIQGYKTKKILLITSQSHMRRAYGLFNGKNIDIDIYSVQKQSSFMKEIFKIKNLVPSTVGLNSTKNSFYELFGFFGYLFLGKIKL